MLAWLFPSSSTNSQEVEKMKSEDHSLDDDRINHNVQIPKGLPPILNDWIREGMERAENRPIEIKPTELNPIEMTEIKSTETKDRKYKEKYEGEITLCYLIHKDKYADLIDEMETANVKLALAKILCYKLKAMSDILNAFSIHLESIHYFDRIFEKYEVEKSSKDATIKLTFKVNYTFVLPFDLPDFFTLQFTNTKLAKRYSKIAKLHEFIKNLATYIRETYYDILNRPYITNEYNAHFLRDYIYLMRLTFLYITEYRKFDRKLYLYPSQKLMFNRHKKLHENSKFFSFNFNFKHNLSFRK